MVTTKAGASVVAVSGLTVHYGGKAVLDNVSFAVKPQEIFAIIGPAQSGKTTLLRVLNRTEDLAATPQIKGSVEVLGQNVFAIGDRTQLRRRVGMVAPLPVGLPMSIYDNVAFAPRCAGHDNRAELDERVERCLRQAALWDEVKDRLRELGTKLSGGQQQRLAIARALSHEPEILCLDEFSIAIDPVTTARIEDALLELQQQMSIVLVTNLTAQARRLSQRTMFLWSGRVVECGPTEQVFGETPEKAETYAYVRGEFG